MKLVLGLDLTDKQHPVNDSEPFIARRLSDDLQRQRDSLEAAISGLQKQTQLPKIVRGIKKLAGLSVLTIPLALLDDNLSDAKRGTSESTNQLFLFIFLAMLALWLLLTWWEIKRARAVVGSPAYDVAEVDAEAFLQAAKKELGVPEEAAKMDVFASRYHWINGEMHAVNSRLIWDYDNVEDRAWREGDCLCLADSVMRLEIPLNDFQGAEKRKNGCYITRWNKEESYRSAAYKPYRVGTVEGQLRASGYLAVQLLHQQETYELRLPLWEADTLQRLTDWPLDAVDAPKEAS